MAQLNDLGKYYTILKRWRVEGTRTYKILIECQCGNVEEKLHTYANTKSVSCGNKCPLSSLARSTAKKGKANRKLMLPKGEVGFRRVYDQYVARAKKFNREFDLSKEEFKELTSMCCYYCGREPSMYYQHKLKGVTEEARENGKYLYNSIDRIDSNLGYVKGNCRTACKVCNNMKVDHAEVDFVQYITKIYNHFAKGYKP